MRQGMVRWLVVIWTLVVGLMADDDQYGELFQALLDCTPATASMGITAVKDGQVVFNKAYGKANIEQDIDNTINTRYSIGSVTKQFTSYLAAKQESEGYFTMYDKIRDIFGKNGVDMSFRGLFRNKAVTISDALTHMTGIKQYEWLLTDDRNFTRAQWMTEKLPHFEEQKEMRAGFYYNNWFYTLIGWLSELVAGESYENLIKTMVLDPLEMTDTMFVTDPAFTELTDQELAQPYKVGLDGVTLYPIPKRVFQLINHHNPAGGLVSTTGDMAKYMIAVLDAMSGAEDSKLDKFVLDVITEPKVMIGSQLGDNVIVNKPTFPVTFLDRGYGYGHIVGTYKGYKYMYHGGSTYGHYSYITFLPDLNMGVFSVISGNDLQPFRIQKLMHIYSLDLMMGENPWINTTTACSFPSPWISDQLNIPAGAPVTSILSSDVTVTNATSFVGNYTNKVFPQLKISLSQSDQLEFTMGNSNGSVLSTEQVGVLCVILNMPIDPLHLPESEKRRVSLTFKYNDRAEVMGVYFEMAAENFYFARNGSGSFFMTSGLTSHISIVFILGIIL